MRNLAEIVAFVDACGLGFLSTKGTCGNPRVRPVRSILYHNDRIYFATASTKNFYKHIQNHPGIEYCACAQDGSFLRLRGEARIAQHLDAKEAMLVKYPIIKEIYADASNPDFAVFYLENISAQLEDSKGQRTQLKA
ncbi:pyridoxamine 5'-phosphate oxidase family protein [uncultured Helicobacter sp.]|uniref:pyridoxamine 5'-phosphate oxidase family protein n=1 Tax=uncultured Helicobacter sp. TaxID=175537 RepID=UPI00374E3AB4